MCERTVETGVVVPFTCFQTDKRDAGCGCCLQRAEPRGGEDGVGGSPSISGSTRNRGAQTANTRRLDGEKLAGRLFDLEYLSLTLPSGTVSSRDTVCTPTVCAHYRMFQYVRTKHRGTRSRHVRTEQTIPTEVYRRPGDMKIIKKRLSRKKTKKTRRQRLKRTGATSKEME